MKLLNFFTRILFYLGWSEKLQSTPYIYQAGSGRIKNTWSDTLPWFTDPDCKNNGVTNYKLWPVPQYGVFTVRAKLEAGHKVHHPAVWMLYIDKFYEELDFELQVSPSRHRLCLYIGSYINHHDSQYHLEGGSLSPYLEQFYVRFCSRKLIDRLLNSFNDYTFLIEPSRVKWYINDRLIAVQKVSIQGPLYFVLSNVYTSLVTIKN